MMPERYTASVQLLIDAGDADAGPAPGVMATQVDILTSQRVALDVVAALKMTDDPEVIARWRREADGQGSLRHFQADLIRENLHVWPSRESRMLHVAYTGDSAHRAAELANAVARAFVELSLALRGESSFPDRGALDAGAVTQEGRRDTTESRSGDDPGESGAAPFGARLDASSRLLWQQRDSSGAQSAREAGSPPARLRPPQPSVMVLNPATEPLRPSSPSVLRNASLGGLLGLLLARAAVLAAERRDRRVRGTQDLRLASGLPPMGTLRNAFSAQHARRLRRGGSESLRHALAGSDGSLDRGPFDDTASVFAPTVIAPRRQGEAGGRPAAPAGAAHDEPPALARNGAAGGTAPNRQALGQILVRAGLIHPPEVERILAWARQEGVRFGEAAVASRLVTSDQVDRALAYQFDYAVLEPGASAVTREVVAAYDARNPLVADLRRLRARIRGAQIAAPLEAPLKALAVISSGSGDGKSFVAANLAVTFSQMGQRTLLVDADLRRGRLHLMFGLPNDHGLSSMLNRRIVPGSLQRVPGLQQLTVLTCGPLAPNPSELLSRPAFGELLDAFGRSFDIVILDTPGVIEEPDATLIAQRAGAAIVMARRGVSSFDAVVELVASGATPQVTVLGSVLNGA